MKNQYKYIVIIIILVFNCIGCTTENNTITNDLTEKGLKGNVKRIREKAYEVKSKFGEPEKDKSLSLYLGDPLHPHFDFYEEETIYDRNGYEIEQTQFEEDKKMVAQSQFRLAYDENNNIIERNKYVRFNLKDTFSFESKERLDYDKKGNMREYKYYDNNGDLEVRWLYEFDNIGNVITIKCYKKNYLSKELDKSSESYYEYNDKNQRIKLHNQNVTSVSMNTGKPSDIDERIIIYKYDSKGNAVEMTEIFGVKKSFESPNAIKYDTIDVFLKYNNYNDIVEKMSVQRKKVLDFKLFFSNGIKEYYNPTKINYFKYEYDSFDNWTKKTEYDKYKEPIKITEREIEYY